MRVFDLLCCPGSGSAGQRSQRWRWEGVGPPRRQVNGVAGRVQVTRQWPHDDLIPSEFLDADAHPLAVALQLVDLREEGQPDLFEQLLGLTELTGGAGLRCRRSKGMNSASSVMVMYPTSSLSLDRMWSNTESEVRSKVVMQPSQGRVLHPSLGYTGTSDNRE